MQTDQTAFPADLADMVAWIVAATPTGGRVLEVGCGDGAVTTHVGARGISVLGVDPHAPEAPHLRAVGLEDLDAPPFDVVFSSVALHHLHDPDRSVDALRRLTRPGTVFLVREFDKTLVDHEPTLRWWFHQRHAEVAALGGAGADEHGLTTDFDAFRTGWREQMEHHVAAWADVRGMLEHAGCTTERETPVPYLYRWGLREAVRPLEEALIASGTIHQVGIRWVGRRSH